MNLNNNTFRGMWISGNDLVFSKDQIDDYYKTVDEMIDNFKLWKINNVMWTVRYYGIAHYASKNSPLKFEIQNSKDYLTYVINKCHENNILFHAWFEPYRIGKEAIEKSISFPLHPANNKDNLYEYNARYILKPTKEESNKFIIQTMQELLDDYDLDGIHFDDYFYIPLEEDEEYMVCSSSLDQKEYEEFCKTNQNFKNNSLEDKANFRRRNVDKMIEDVHNFIKNYNESNQKHIIFGVSPSGVYASGDGIVTYENKKAISNGSRTKDAFEHYNYYLFSDTLKWCDMGWIDYLIPQIYTSLDYSPDYNFRLICTWWHKMFRYRKTKIYSGMAVYRYTDYYQLHKDDDEEECMPYTLTELTDEIKFASKYTKNGFCIFRYEYLEIYFKEKPEELIEYLKLVK